MTKVVEEGRVLVVEGDLPAGLPDPYSSAMGLRRDRRVRPVAEAVVMGTHMTGGTQVRLDIQLLRVKDRAVLYSTNQAVKNDFMTAATIADLRDLPGERPDPLRSRKAPSAPKEPEELATSDGQLPGWEQEEEGPDCGQAAVEVDRLQSSIMDIKARYVARKLKEAGRNSPERAKSLIQDVELRNQFDMAVHHYLESSAIPALSTREIRTLLVVDGKAFQIHSRCFAHASGT
ncbi:MAG: hypothetical protein HY554_08620 [Elusimicrobia bacterium]|nr:hypothetical protein [Elusimicrobiota bacterium]